MSRPDNTELIDRFDEFYRSYYRNEIGELAQKYPNEQKSLYIDWQDLYQFDPDLADDVRNKPQQLQEYAEEALRLYDLPVDVSLGQAHVRIKHLPKTTDIREIRADHRGMLIEIQGIVRKATDVRPKITTAAFECQRCGTLSRIPQEGDFQEPHECQGCERQGPFRINYDQSEFIDAQKLRVQESPEGLRGGETPQSIDVNIEDDITGEVTAGDHVAVSGILKLEQQGNDREKSAMFDVYMDGLTVEIEDEQFEEMDITDEDKKEIIELSNRPNIYEQMIGAIAPSIYGYEKEKQAMIFQLFSGVTKFLPDGSRTRGDLHILLVGDPGTGKCQRADTEILLGDGTRREIGDLVEQQLDDPVEIEDGYYQPVDIGVLTTDGHQIQRGRATKVWKRDAPDQMYQIQTASGRQLEVTPSHPLFVEQDGDLEPVVAAELTEKEVLAVPRELQSGEPETDPESDTDQLVGSEIGRDRIESIRALEPEYDWVYDLEVKDTHAYISEGVISHNSQLLQYVKNIAPRSVYTSGKGSSSAGLTAAAVRDDFGEGQQWTLEAGALVLADQGIAAVDELDKMRCVRGETLVHTADGRRPVRELAAQAEETGAVTHHENGRTIRDTDLSVWTMTDEGTLTVRDVTAIHEYEAPETLREVTLESGKSLTSTADHPYFLLEGGKRREKPADELEPGDWVYVPKSVPAPVSDGGTTAPDTAHAAGPSHSSVPDDRTELLPGCQPLFEQVRQSLRLSRSDCGLADGESELSRSEAARVLERFQKRCEQARDDMDTLESCSWDDLDTLRERYNVADRELSGEYARDRFSELWGTDTKLKKAVKRALTEIIESVRDTELTQIRRLVESDVSWRRVESVQTRPNRIESEDSTGTDRSIPRVYDLTVEGTHNFLANGIVVHNSEDQSAMHEALEQQSYHPSTEVLLADGRRVTVGEFVDEKIETNSERVEEGIDCEILPTDGIGVHTVDLETNSLGKTDIDRVSRHEAPDRFVRVEFSNGRDVLVTPEHPMFVQRDGKHTTVEARELDEGTLVPAPQQLPDAAEPVSLSDTPGTGTDLDCPETLTPELSELLGVLVADGCAGSGDGLCLSSHSEHLQSRLRELFGSVFHSDRTERVELTSPALSDWLESTFPELQSSETRLPAAVLGASKACIRRFLVGAFAVERARESTGLSFSAASKELAEDYADALAKIGVGSRISQDSCWHTQVVETDRNRFQRQLLERTAKPTRRESDALRCYRVREIETVPNEGEHACEWVYDLTVEPTNTFLSKGVVLHNSISVSKAGINATLKSRCSLLGAANPTYGRFDQYEPIGEQIDLAPPLISRFDLIFTVTDQPDEQEDAELAEHILQTNYAGELNTHREETPTSNYTEEEVKQVTEDVSPTIDPEFFRKYVAYARRNCYPTMTEEAKRAIRDYYVDLRAEGASEDAPVPVTARKLEALVRLAEASARVRLSDTVEKDDADRAIDIAQYCLEEIGLDPETGELDADVVETGTSKSQRDRIKNIKALIENIEEEYDEGAPVDVIIERAEEQGMKKSKAEHEIEKLKQKGEVYEPQTDHLRTT